MPPEPKSRSRVIQPAFFPMTRSRWRPFSLQITRVIQDSENISPHAAKNTSHAAPPAVCNERELSEDLLHDDNISLCHSLARVSIPAQSLPISRETIRQTELGGRTSRMRGNQAIASGQTRSSRWNARQLPPLQCDEASHQPAPAPETDCEEWQFPNSGSKCMSSREEPERNSQSRHVHLDGDGAS